MVLSVFLQRSIIGMIEHSSIACSKKLYISDIYQLGHFAIFFILFFNIQ